jgi:hypothetical protein
LEPFLMLADEQLTTLPSQLAAPEILSDLQLRLRPSRRCPDEKNGMRVNPLLVSREAAKQSSGLPTLTFT